MKPNHVHNVALKKILQESLQVRLHDFQVEFHEWSPRCIKFIAAIQVTNLSKNVSITNGFECEWIGPHK